MRKYFNAENRQYSTGKVCYNRGTLSSLKRQFKDFTLFFLEV